MCSVTDREYRELKNMGLLHKQRGKDVDASYREQKQNSLADPQGPISDW